mmetsp:Transcript_15226/g.31567  ORF Transcript_15226/g.31567 Transcript_15226/m.31567 type:complete len:305 (+) Transcript_15226:190-1104(+)
MGWSATAAKLFVWYLATQWSSSGALASIDAISGEQQVGNTQVDSVRQLRGAGIPRDAYQYASHRDSAGEISRGRDSGTIDIASSLERDSSVFVSESNTYSQQQPHADEISVCRKMTLDFSKASNGRSMFAGAFVRGDWFHSFGVNIDAEGHDGSKNVHPMIFDSGNVENNGMGNQAFALGSPNFDCEGFGVGAGGKIGKAGENCKPLGNMLIPSQKPVQSTGGVLIFEFLKTTTVENIGFLNLGSSDQIMVVRKDGSMEKISLFSVGQNGYQNINLDMENVQKLHVSLHSFGAVTGLDLCISAE